MDYAIILARPDANGPARRRIKLPQRILGRYHRFKGPTNLSPAAAREVDARTRESRARSEKANAKIEQDFRDAGIVVDADELPPKPFGKQVLDAVRDIAEGIVKVAVRVHEIANQTDKKNAQLAAYGPLPKEVQERVVITSE